jgi:hypothetical protein
MSGESCGILRIFLRWRPLQLLHCEAQRIRQVLEGIRARLSFAPQTVVSRVEVYVCLPRPPANGEAFLFEFRSQERFARVAGRPT